MIKIITDEYLRAQKIYRYKYEVVSQDSKYFGLVDIAYTKECLRANLIYQVTMNRDKEYPKFHQVIMDMKDQIIITDIEYKDN